MHTSAYQHLRSGQVSVDIRCSPFQNAQKSSKLPSQGHSAAEPNGVVLVRRITVVVTCRRAHVVTGVEPTAAAQPTVSMMSETTLPLNLVYNSDRERCPCHTKPIVQPSRNGQQAADVVKTPDPEVVPKAERRRFSAEYKLRILAEADACTQRGEIGALLRREGLYRSHLDKWREQRRAGALQALAPQKRGPKPDPQAAEIARLRRENERLQQRLQRAETIIEVQKKLSALLGLPTSESDEQL